MVILYLFGQTIGMGDTERVAGEVGGDAVLATFGMALKNARLSAGLTQEALSDLSGLDRTYVSGAERGLRNPTLATLNRLASALNLTVSELLSPAGQSWPR